jgi:hypothetical protein
VPEEVRQAIRELVQPAYERLVLAPDDPLERTLGVTLAHLLWLEVLQQFDLKRHYVETSAVLRLAENPGPAIEQHLRILYAKVKVGHFLARVRELRDKSHRGSAAPISARRQPASPRRSTAAPGATPRNARPPGKSQRNDRGPPNTEKRKPVDQTPAKPSASESVSLLTIGSYNAEHPTDHLAPAAK